MKMSDGMDFPFLFPIPLFLTCPYGFSLLGFVPEWSDHDALASRHHKGIVMASFFHFLCTFLEPNIELRIRTQYQEVIRF